MKREEILEANKKDNKMQDEYEIELGFKATRIGAFCAIILTTVYYCYEIFTGKGSNPTLYSIITVFCAGASIYKGIKVDRNRHINIFSGVVWLIVTIMIVVNYFMGK